MLKRVSLLSLTVILAVVMASCIFNPDEGGGDDVDPYPDLTTKNAVLHWLELSYNDRQIQKYQTILDKDFTMFFSEGDVSGGKTPEQWGRQDEIDANRNLFNPAYDPPGETARCLDIELNVRWEDGVVWQEIQPASAPEETWYTATVFYNFRFDVEPDLHLINNNGSKAQFTVRELTDGTWRLVEFRDLDGI